MIPVSFNGSLMSDSPPPQAVDGVKDLPGFNGSYEVGHVYRGLGVAVVGGSVYTGAYER